uniref:Uncharacterized protein n=1 Tax=Rhinolophus ferrumequinum TaxID=59479 RepID=A0A671DU07_RHIFE
MQHRGCLLLTLLTLLVLTSAVAKKEDSVNKGSPGIEYTEWTLDHPPCTPKAKTKAKAKEGKGNN